MSEPAAQVQAFVSGRVQGVGFRYFVRRAAESLGLSGWVRNLRDGRVELVAMGPRSQLQELLVTVNQGPPGSRVDEVLESWQDDGEELAGFLIKPTA